MAFDAGFALHGGAGLTALSNGTGLAFKNGVAASGTTQAGSAQLASFAMFSIDTVAASSGVALPGAVAGTTIDLYNNGANTLTVYPMIINNPLTGAQDTINNSTSTTLSSHTSGYFFCAKNGVWCAK